MKSIGARLAAWYALTATATLAILFVAGYFLLQNNLIRGLDLLNAAEYEQIRSRLGPDPKSLDPSQIDARIRETTEYAKVLFYIDVHSPGTGTIFRSMNLDGKDIPDVKGKRTFNAFVDNVGELRVGEFILTPFEVTIGTSLGQVHETMSFYVNVCAGLLTAMLVSSIFIGIGMSRMVLRPVRAIRATAMRIGSDNLAERIPVGEVKDEISDLAQLLNQMFDRLAESFDQIRRFAADASHELKTPLALVRLHAERLLVDGALSPSQRDSIHVQLEEVTRLNRIIEELLFLSRADAQAIRLLPAAQDPADLLRDFVQDAAVLAEHKGCRFVHSHGGEGRVEVESNRIRQVLMNLVSNAIKATPPGRTITLHSELRERTWRVSVTDEGPGLLPEQRDKLFERFVRFATDDANDRGSGLGLAICRSIVALHGGRIYAEPGPGGKGLRVVVEIAAEHDEGHALRDLAGQQG